VWWLVALTVANLPRRRTASPRNSVGEVTMKICYKYYEMLYLVDVVVEGVEESLKPGLNSNPH
jgi:hypothetical protein